MTITKRIVFVAAIMLAVGALWLALASIERPPSRESLELYLRESVIEPDGLIQDISIRKTEDVRNPYVAEVLVTYVHTGDDGSLFEIRHRSTYRWLSGKERWSLIDQGGDVLPLR